MELILFSYNAQLTARLKDTHRIFHEFDADRNQDLSLVEFGELGEDWRWRCRPAWWCQPWGCSPWGCSPWGCQPGGANPDPQLNPQPTETILEQYMGGRFTSREVDRLYAEMRPEVGGDSDDEGSDDGIEIDEQTFGRLCLRRKIFLKHAHEEVRGPGPGAGGAGGGGALLIALCWWWWWLLVLAHANCMLAFS